MGYTDDQIEYMRQDLASGMSLTKLIMHARERLETEGKNFGKEFERWKEDYKKESGMLAKMDLFVDMVRPDSGCDISESMDILMFTNLFSLSSGNVCNGCIYDEKCAFRKKKASDAKAIRIADFGKHQHKTNADMAKDLGVTKRQVAKMRKRGELDA